MMKMIFDALFWLFANIFMLALLGGALWWAWAMFYLVIRGITHPEDVDLTHRC